MLDIALGYHRNGFTVIPVRDNKKPKIAWEKYQETKPTEEEIKAWFGNPNGTGIGLVCGEASDITVLDVDDEDAEKAIEKVVPGIKYHVKTPKGKHAYFRNEYGMRNKTRICGINADIRGEGGYVVAAPSWSDYVQQLPFSDIPAMPDALKNYITSNTRMYNTLGKDTSIIYKSVTTSDNKRQQTTTNVTFDEGGRDDTLFHIANCLTKGGMVEQNTRKVLLTLAKQCSPPFPEEEVNAKINSALARSGRRDLGLTEEIREWVVTTSGNFLTTDVFNFLNLTTRDNKKKATVALLRLCKEGLIEKYGTRRGSYRTVDKDLEFEDLTKASVDPLDIWLPLRLNTLSRVFPGNILAIAGAPNSGKTAFLLACTRYNFKKHKVRYLTSEMGVDEARMRIEEFSDITVKEWQKHWEFAERYDNFEDALLTGKGNINIIDYLEAPAGEAYMASEHLKQIHKKLDGAIAIVALQKQRGMDRDTGVGGDQTLAKPRLYVAMDHGKAKIVKCKSFVKGVDNPNGKVCDFKLHDGGNFELSGRGWVRDV